MPERLTVSNLIVDAPITLANHLRDLTDPNLPAVGRVGPESFPDSKFERL
jgi:hypothetical protein